jgi:hypothetical protein
MIHSEWGGLSSPWTRIQGFQPAASRLAGNIARTT